MTSKSSIPTIQKFIAILWPVVAGFVTVLFFIVFDPDILLEAGDFEDISLLSTALVFSVHGYQ